jgi:predicted transcriptional regulator
MASHERKSPVVRYPCFVTARLSERLFARVHEIADARELRVSELVRDAIMEKLAKIEAEEGAPMR